MNTFWQESRTHLKLEAGQVHIWKADLYDFLELNPNQIRLLSLEEQQRAARFVSREHRHNFAMSHLLLRTILSRYLNLPVSEFSFRFNQYGKPYLINEGASNVFFNLSHSQHLVLFALALDQEVGIDIEWINPKIPYLELSSRFFSFQEHQALIQLPPQEQLSTFYRIWVRKEAYIKAIGEGLSHNLSSFDVYPDQPSPIELDGWKLIDINAASDYAAALTLPKLFNPKLWLFTPSNL